MSSINYKLPENSIYYSEKFIKILGEYIGTLDSGRYKVEVARTIKQICEMCEKDFLDISGRDVTKYFSSCEHLSGETFNTRKSILHKMAIYILSEHPEIEGYADYYALVKSKKYTSGIKQSQVPDLDIVDRILEEAKTMKEGKMLYTILVMVFRCCFTATDVLELEPKDISDVDGTMSVSFSDKNKYTKADTIKIPDDVATVIREYMAVRPKENYLFVNQWGNKLTLKNLDILVAKVMKNCGCQQFSIKDLRTRAILDITKASQDNDQNLETCAQYARIKGMRLESFIKATALAEECPTELVNIRIKTE